MAEPSIVDTFDNVSKRKVRLVDELGEGEGVRWSLPSLKR